MPVIVSLAGAGANRWWEIPDDALDDQGLLEMETAEMDAYLRSCDAGLDSRGPFATQVRDAVYSVIDHGPAVALTLACSETGDLYVEVRLRAAYEPEGEGGDE